MAESITINIRQLILELTSEWASGRLGNDDTGNFQDTDG